MKKPSRILLAFAAMIMLFAFGCACADITEGLIPRIPEGLPSYSKEICSYETAWMQRFY